ncbi:MAG: hypothetical protein SVV80_13490 [Planctomycetota bacterium]|nr:hypothetical protein [Planctomycetota bacterium]
MRDKTHPFTIVTLLFLLLAGGVSIVSMYREQGRPLPQCQSAMCISEPQIRKVWEAIGGFSKEHNRRPEQLEMLTAGGYLKQADLFDARRKDAPAIDGQTGRFVINPDVLYFPALREEDPADLIVLCTVLLAAADGKYHAVFNDGRYAALAPHELVMALNRTYEYIGGEVISLPASSQPGE